MKYLYGALATITIALALSIGCNVEPRWKLDYRPITQEERDAVDRHVKEVISLTKRDLTVSGSDQDIEDWVEEIYKQARMSLCRPRLFEYIGDGYTETGRYRDYTEAK